MIHGYEGTPTSHIYILRNISPFISLQISGSICWDIPYTEMPQSIVGNMLGHISGYI